MAVIQRSNLPYRKCVFNATDDSSWWMVGNADIGAPIQGMLCGERQFHLAAVLRRHLELAEQGPHELIGQFGIVTFSHNHVSLEPQRLVGKRLQDHILRPKVERIRFCDDSTPNFSKTNLTRRSVVTPA